MSKKMAEIEKRMKVIERKVKVLEKTRWQILNQAVKTTSMLIEALQEERK
jgi:hypothetical protein